MREKREIKKSKEEKSFFTMTRDLKFSEENDLVEESTYLNVAKTPVKKKEEPRFSNKKPKEPADEILSRLKSLRLTLPYHVKKEDKARSTPKCKNPLFRDEEDECLQVLGKISAKSPMKLKAMNESWKVPEKLAYENKENSSTEKSQLDLKKEKYKRRALQVPRQLKNFDAISISSDSISSEIDGFEKFDKKSMLERTDSLKIAGTSKSLGAILGDRIQSLKVTQIEVPLQRILIKNQKLLEVPDLVVTGEKFAGNDSLLDLDNDALDIQTLTPVKIEAVDEDLEDPVDQLIKRAQKNCGIPDSESVEDLFKLAIDEIYNERQAFWNTLKDGDTEENPKPLDFSILEDLGSKNSSLSDKLEISDSEFSQLQNTMELKNLSKEDLEEMLTNDELVYFSSCSSQGSCRDVSLIDDTPLRKDNKNEGKFFYLHHLVDSIDFLLGFQILII